MIEERAHGVDVIGEDAGEEEARAMAEAELAARDERGRDRDRPGLGVVEDRAGRVGRGVLHAPTLHRGGYSQIAVVLAIVVPLIIQTMTRPVLLFRQTMSGLLSPLNDPIARGTQSPPPAQMTG